MLRRLIVAAVSALLLIDAPSPAAASDVVVTGPSCTFLYSAAEREEMLALSGVFAANWSAEILRDIPAAADDLAVARTWHADKTSDALPSMPEHVRAAIERVNTAGHRVGYAEDEAVAPLRILVERNDLRESQRPWQILDRDDARDRLAASRDRLTPTLLSESRDGLSVAAGESWLRAWERTPGAQTESEASRAELALCATGTAGSVNRSTAQSDLTPPPATRLPLLGVPMGKVHSAFVMALLEDVGSLPESLR